MFSSKRKKYRSIPFFIDLSSDWNWTKTKLDEARQGDRTRRQCDEDSNLINKLVLLDFCISTFPSSFRIRFFKKVCFAKISSWRISCLVRRQNQYRYWFRIYYFKMSEVAVRPVTQLQIFVEHVYRCITRCSPPNRGLQQVPFKASKFPLHFRREKGGRVKEREGVAKTWRKRMIPFDRTSD